MKRFLKSLILFLNMWKAISLIGQDIPEPYFPQYDLTASRQFLQQHYRSAPMSLPLGFALGQVDSVSGVIYNSSNNITRYSSRLEYLGDRIVYIYQVGVPDTVGFFADTIDVPVQVGRYRLDTIRRSSRRVISLSGRQREVISSTQLYIERSDGRVVSRRYVYENSILPPSVIEEAFEYVGDSTITQVTHFARQNSPTIIIDSTIYTFYSSGQLASCTQYAEFPFEELASPASINSEYEIEYVNNGDFYISGFRADVSNQFDTHINYGNEIDSASVIYYGSFASEQNIYRIDDGRDVNIRSYINLSSSGRNEESTFYYRNRISSVKDAEVIPGSLIGPNPILCGQVLKLENLPVGARLQLIGLNGTYYEVSVKTAVGTQIIWPELPKGLYLITASANGYATRAWKLISG